MTQKEKTSRRINSEHDAQAYWEEEFGSPEYFSEYTELTDVENKLVELQVEQEKLNREINNRDVLHMNEYKINRAIELYFLIKIGTRYFEECTIQVGMIEDKMEKEFSREFDDIEDRCREDSLFPRNYED